MAVQCRSWDEAELQLDTAFRRMTAIELRLRTLEKKIDTLSSPLWKRILFRIDGWPPWYIVATKRAWRPWHRWLRSS